ncbi:hypothetical protein FOD75_11445 (plasmid) [Limosilactobacillus reuteri]|uniref:Uncharacterized protein n=1 Tax=Limosilactobacillus reuteri TaxID=1598 RepID=A0A517D8X5_LIMRT|nr:hypothetical protein FOD75_11445 [Limosilactobacillus reuteri]
MPSNNEIEYHNLNDIGADLSNLKTKPLFRKNRLSNKKTKETLINAVFKTGLIGVFYIWRKIK